MTLPPSIEALLTSGSDVWLVHAVANEACRLQRDADEEYFLKGRGFWGSGPTLVVPSTENEP